MAKRIKKNVQTKKTKTKLSPDILIISMIVVSILLGVLIYTNAGQIGAVISPVLGGLIGVIKYVIPVGIFITAISLIKENSSYVNTKVTQFVAFTICISVLMHVYQFSKIDLAPNITFEEIINEAYELGTSNQGGGAIGAIIGTPLVNLISSLGTSILAIAIGLITFMYLTGRRP